MNMERMRRARVGEIAERLYQRPTTADYRGAPIPVEEALTQSLPREDGNNHVRAALKAIVERLGFPAQYGGSGIGPSIRWQSATDTLLLDQGRSGLQLSIHRSDDLNDRELSIFRQGVGSAPNQVATYNDLPYLWQVIRKDGAELATFAPSSPPASDWPLLEESFRSLLMALSNQLPAQLGSAAVGFNVTNRADGDRVLAVLCNPHDELMALIDGTDSPDQWSPGHTEYEAAILSRGWHSEVPFRWWEATFPRGMEGATDLAALIVRELRHRGARDPADLDLSELTVDETLETGGIGADLGKLLLPGLGVNPPSNPSPARPSPSFDR
ncbi:hypothetical protein ACFYQ5_21050 [Streptomyces sp. NPDC005794]|uniref:hypothetical protein n=1 Tax=Streptomyces sp. NPDC005794 TaxID=3364733 RepID=UPI00367AA4C6